MSRQRPIFYNAMMLTGVNLLLRMVSTSFQVFISGRIGASGVGLLQLVLSVANFTMTAGVAGVRTACMYLTAEELGKKRSQNMTWVLSGCFVYSLIFSCSVGIGVYSAAPWIATHWIGNIRMMGAVRLFAVFLPVSCLTGVMIGYFTAANRIATLAAVEVGEQLCSMAVTTAALLLWAGDDIARACQSVVLGGCVGSCMTLALLVALRIAEKEKTGPRIPVRRRLTAIALPLAVADDLKVGITTTENLMVPKRLALYSGAGDALAQFGTVCGMVFPVLMFPAAILFGLADLLIPELARCNASGTRRRIRYLARRSLRLALFYGILCGGILYLLAEPLCILFYKSGEAGQYLRWFAWLAPMLYCDAVVDAMNKGLGQQKICMQYNILTSAMDVIGLFFLLPVLGIRGYFISFLVSHAVNAALSLRLLLRVTGLRIGIHIPFLTMGAMSGAVMGADLFLHPFVKGAAFALLALGCLYLTGVLYPEDIRWTLGLLGFEKKKEKS